METGTCECGCGGSVNPGRRFRKGHYIRTITPEEQSRRCGKKIVGPETREKCRVKMLDFVAGPKVPVGDLSTHPLCACGCGDRVRKLGNQFLWGHHSRTQNHKDTAAANCRGRTGAQHTSSARNRMSATKKALFAAGLEPWNRRLTKEVHPSVALHNKGLFKDTEAHYAFSFPTNSTRPEAAVQIELVRRGIAFLFNVPIKGVCRPDFILPFGRIIIQVDGAYWHRGREDKDADQDAKLTELGWLVFRWPEGDIQHFLSDLADVMEMAYRSRLLDCQGSGLLDASADPPSR